MTEEHGSELLKKAKEDLDEGMRIISLMQWAMVEYEDRCLGIEL